jgi:hypothetical protein
MAEALRKAMETFAAAPQVIATIMKKSSDNAHFTKKLLKRLYEAAVAQHNARVDFVIFFLRNGGAQSRLPGRSDLRQCGRVDRRPPQTCALIVPVRIARTKGFLKACAKLTSEDPGNSHYQLVDVDRHDRIDRRYSD